MKHLEEIIINYDKKLMEADKEIERLTKRLKEAQLGYLAVEEKNKKLHSIIKEVREYMKSIEHEPDADMYIELGQYKEYKHILEILDKENTCTNCGQENE